MFEFLEYSFNFSIVVLRTKSNLAFYHVKCNGRFLSSFNGLESEISRTFLDFLHLGHEFFVISGHGT